MCCRSVWESRPDLCGLFFPSCQHEISTSHFLFVHIITVGKPNHDYINGNNGRRGFLDALRGGLRYSTSSVCTFRTRLTPGNCEQAPRAETTVFSHALSKKINWRFWEYNLVGRGAKKAGLIDFSGWCLQKTVINSSGKTRRISRCLNHRIGRARMLAVPLHVSVFSVATLSNRNEIDSNKPAANASSTRQQPRKSSSSAMAFHETAIACRIQLRFCSAEMGLFSSSSSTARSVCGPLRPDV